MKYAWMDTQRGYFRLRAMCSVLLVSPSGYRVWKRGGTPSRKRRHSTLGDTSPIQFMEYWMRGQYGEKRVA